MTPRHILIAYATGHGQTAKVARAIADRLMEAGDAVTLVRADELPHHRDLPRGMTPADFDAVVVGASVHFGRHQRAVHDFVRAHRDALARVPGAFFSVSGAAADPSSGGQAEARRYVDEFTSRTGWRPERTETIAGAMSYTQYSPVMRWVLRGISRRRGGPTDASRDHEMTDWAQVGRFADAIAARLAPPGSGGDARPTPAQTG